MKKLMLMSALTIALSLSAVAQKNHGGKVPEKVMNAFKAKFPEASHVRWEKENATEWEAEFEMNEREYSANFSNEGEWKETEYRIRRSEVPANIFSILDENFSDYEIEKGEVADTPQGRFYEFEIEVGKDEFEVIIDPQGKLTRETEDDDE